MSVSVGTEYRGTKLKVVYHEYDSDKGGLDFGSELDIDVAHRLSEEISIGMQYADYSSKDASLTPGSSLTDTRKFWFWMSFNF